MYQLLLVEDEPMLLNSMVDNDWRSIGIGHVYQAQSGLDALEILETTPIDVVVTDIRMPGMDGLELCKRIHERFSWTRCILLSGYSEFTYAQQAIQYRTVNYLLKPLKDTDLMAEVARTIETLKREWEQIVSTERAMNTLRMNLPLLRSNLLNELLAGARRKLSALPEMLKVYDVPFHFGDRFSLIMVRVDHWFEKSQDHDVPLFEYAVDNIANEMMGNDFDLWSCKDALGYLVFIIKERNTSNEESETRTRSVVLEKAVHQLQIHVRNYLKGAISILLSNSGCFPEDLAPLYRKALSDFRKVPRSDGELILIDSDASSSFQIGIMQSLYTPPTVLQLLEAGRWQDAHVKIGEIVEEMNCNKLDSEEHIMEVVYSLLNAFVFCAHLQGRPFAEIAGEEAEQVNPYQSLKSTSQIGEWAHRILDRLEARAVRELHDVHQHMTQKIQRFIETHISGEVSLQAIADHVGVHPVYLSSKYKKETGKNISDFILRFRMEKAGLLLRTSDIKIYELAQQLGFLIPPYFSKLFKKHYGMTPQEYRDRYGMK